MAAKLELTLIKSPIKCPQHVKDTVRGLGLRRMHQTIIRSDTPEIRGMVKKVIQMLTVKEFSV